MNEVFWFLMGVCTGILVLMTIQVLIAKRDKHFMQYSIKTPLQKETVDWDMGELDRVIPIPRDQTPVIQPIPKPIMQECPDCGKAFKRVSQHRTRMHKTVGS